MCSFLVTDQLINNLRFANQFIKQRGPDATNEYHIHHYTFIHNLLSITGEMRNQPFVSDDQKIVCIYNGQIYNYRDFGFLHSDGECLIPAYQKYGESFTQQLDGEFALVLFDFEKRLLIVSSDTFRTKPLWYSISKKGVGIGSYKSCLDRIGLSNSVQFPANTTHIYNLDTLTCLNKFNVVNFDLTQHKTTFQDWRAAFKQSIYKRVHGCREKIFIGLSSGYDSGAIACELNNQKISYRSYTVLGSECKEIIQRRIQKMNENASYELMKDRRLKYKSYIQKHVEPYYYTIHSSSSDYNEYDMLMHDDNGAMGLSYVCAKARKKGYKIYLSGQGADELFSDYGFNGEKKYLHSNFGGFFPEDLTTIYPWASFFGSSMESYLAKEEYVSGSYGIEGRYPFLDRQVVQEFLWLSYDLKNSYYKSVLYDFLTTNKYPFKENVKTGF